MKQMITVAVDAMGGDNAPHEIVKGCIQALESNNALKIKLVGKADIIKKELAQFDFNDNKIEMIDATEVISVEESPVAAIRKKKDSSIVKGLKLVKDKEADAFISAGSSGAVLAGGTFIVGRIKGVERPALAPLLPTKNGYSLLIDCGANVDSKPSYLVQFAKMGTIYMKNILNISNPKVGLINIGVEAGKGNALVKEAYYLLKEEHDKGHINFVGNIEARDVTDGEADILVCDAFVGNIILKNMEGLGKYIFKLLKEEIMSSTRGKIGGLMLKPTFKKLYHNFDASEVGGAPMLGLEGLVVKAHGNSDAKAIKNAIAQCEKFVTNNVKETIKDNLSMY